ncbi:AAA family ATPase [Sabulicella glaciei]|uniref:AAA family ATPase n=1 Tax=Sabulicella glaciei TaxID=2984948 RepID=A0ABT3P1I6_9PROT|nr:AAA family ATPase [Roseococcus sp. MDT2-1-1]MCW8088290.1 AAA family ATPase [Roseococcus sp. MDT2-1-1]
MKTSWHPVLFDAMAKLRKRQALIIAKRNEDRRPVKHLRAFSTKEAATFLGITESYLRVKIAEGDGFPQGEKSGSTRWFTLQEINRAREHLAAKSHDRYRVGKGEFDRPFVITGANYKGGVGKSTITVHLAQYLALRGYRVLLVDLDAQGSTTSLFGLDPTWQVGFGENGELLPGGATINAWIDRREGEDRQAAEQAIVETYWPNIDLVCANARLQHVESLLAARKNSDRSTFGADRPYDMELKGFVEHVGKPYDVVIFDTRPDISLLTLNAFTASNGLLLPILPSSVDLRSMADFLGYLGKIEQHNQQFLGSDWEGWQFIKIFCNRYVNTSRPQADMLESIEKDVHKDLRLADHMVETSALATAGNIRWTLYEHAPAKSEDRSHKRALAAMDAIGLSIENEILAYWGRAKKDRSAASQLMPA